MPKKKQFGAMTWAEIGRREGISGEAARQCYERGMAKLRRFSRRDIVAMMKFYADAMQRERERRSDGMEAAIEYF